MKLKFKVGDYLLLERTNTIVWVEAITAVAVKVVALPEQAEDTDRRVFTPGSLRAKAISPFIQESPLKATAISDRNREFIEQLDALRAEHGLGFIDQPAQEIAMPAAAAPKKTKSKGPSPAPAAKPTSKATDPSFRLFTSKPLDKAIAKNPRYEKGRGRRVIEALRGLKDSTGTLEEIVRAVDKDGSKKLADSEKVVRRALHQLQLESFGAVVTKVDE